MSEGGIGAIWPAPPAYYREPLRAPPAPPSGEYRMYGITRPALGSLPPQPPLDEQLYSASTELEAISELRRLNRTLLSKFVTMLRTMQDAPTQSSTHVAEIRALIFNIQHLLNSLRPYQAREELIFELQAQVKAKQKLVNTLQEGVEAAAAAALDDEPEPAASGDGSGSGSGSGAAAADAARAANAPSMSSSAARELLASMGQQQGQQQGSSSTGGSSSSSASRKRKK